MDAKEFDEIVERMLARTRSVLVSKAGEYATDDRLHNFKVSGATQGITPMQALAGMMAKHTVSIYDMIRKGKPYSRGLWEEKLTDHINYLILLRGLIEEEEQKLAVAIKTTENTESPQNA